ncbi:MAG: hypothetical protein PHC94_14430 [Methylobacter sp.]|nr:hypothetical protein [Methylobacter sp.]
MKILKIHHPIEIAVHAKSTWAAPYTVSILVKRTNRSADNRVSATIYD